MGAYAKALGSSSEIEHKGQTYKVGPATQDVKAMFEAWMEKQAFDALRAAKAKGNLSDDEYREERTALLRDIGSKKLTFHSAYMAGVMATLDGQKAFCLLMIKQNHPDVSMQLVDSIFEEKLDEIIDSIDAHMADDPNGQAPASKPGENQ